MTARPEKPEHAARACKTARAIPPPSPRPAPIDIRDILGDAAERLILNGDDVYRLRLTRAGKLILTK